MSRSTATRPTTRGAAPGARRPAPARQRQQPRSELEVLPRSAGRGVRVLAVAGMVLAFAVVFGLVAFHAMIAAQQDQLDATRAALTAAQADHDDLRLEVATLQSPDRIVTEAEERLGMVLPGSVEYLQPILESDLATVPADGDATPAAGE